MDNKLIAEFVGLKKIEFKSGLVNYKHTDYHVYDEKHHTTWYEGEELAFDKSWDWLMPVIDKIYHLEYEHEDNIENIEDALSTKSITDTYKAVIKFIKDYNNGKQ
tara:strand:+ start:765 stop:1079 length:315 start_codon:yes stop_codon:yes gene_type:complete